MPIYDFECKRCGKRKEFFYKVADCPAFVFCPKCSGEMVKIISVNGVNTANQDAEWLKSVREVVDKEGGPHCQAFLKDPTRDNYKRWMKGEGIRPLEPGERPKVPKPDIDRVSSHLARRLQEMQAIKL